ncbi:MAG: putative membrane protein [Candidatus Accumulibacter appositus]|uniref:Putative membrane protein n=1 Tax=Candidatus Accumulibacter appositus TaxID=1454003 RepID=A0A011PKI4_9PROT|nr:phage holin family protein [Accumulibacter sp.]EXI77537.1 MAG: putative membrane protein [Candidatus Accumulibacter appositus]HRF05377.1 phage holin family protein [Accumulibacter sp.]
MSDTTGGVKGGGGLFAGTRNGAIALLGTGRTRLELLGNELKEEKLRAVRLLLWSQMLAFCVALGTILLVGLLVVVFWEQRVVLLATTGVLFIACGGLAYIALQRSMRRPDHLFAASLAQLEEDLRQLKQAAGDESRAD